MSPRRSRSSLEAVCALVAAQAVFTSGAVAQTQFEELRRRHLPAGVDYTRSFAFGDVDGDGDLDLICGNIEGGTYAPGRDRLYVNDGAGVFTDVTATQMPVDAEGAFSSALGDVDGDGDLDVVCGTFGQNRLYVNDGTGVFIEATATQLPVESDITGAVVLGDVDGDGDLDLICGNLLGYRSRAQNRLFVNDGVGVFTDATATLMPLDSDGTFSMALGDVDGDGDLDVLCGNIGQNRLYVNDGTGSFTDATATRMPVDNDRTESVVLGDVDGDGDLDVICGNGTYIGQQNRLYVNDGAGVFSDATTMQLPLDSDHTGSLALGDVDSDGDLDLICGNVELFFGGERNRLYVSVR